MARARKQVTHRTAKEQAIDELYAEIPSIPDCDGRCAAACGPIAMFKGEWERVKRSAGRTPKLRAGGMCPMLSSTGKCTVYTVRPFICRLWGATMTLQCPHGCKPERWLTKDEARVIFKKLEAIVGPDVRGPLGSIDLWQGFALDDREQRMTLIEQVQEVRRRESSA